MTLGIGSDGENRSYSKTLSNLTLPVVIDDNGYGADPALSGVIRGRRHQEMSPHSAEWTGMWMIKCRYCWEYQIKLTLSAINNFFLMNEVLFTGDPGGCYNGGKI